MDDKDEILEALDDFAKIPGGKISHVLEQYLGRIATTGVTVFPWAKLKPLLIQKLDSVVHEFQERSPISQQSPSPNIEDFTFEVIRKRLIDDINQFNGIPFTIQRLCELVTNPMKHYKTTYAFMHALLKNLDVMTTIDPYGNRIVSDIKVESRGIEVPSTRDYQTYLTQPDPQNSSLHPPVPVNSPTTSSTGSCFSSLSNVVDSATSYPNSSNQETSSRESSTEKRSGPEESNSPEPPHKMVRLDDAADTAREIDGANDSPETKAMQQSTTSQEQVESNQEEATGTEESVRASKTGTNRKVETSSTEVPHEKPLWMTNGFTNYLKVSQALCCLKDALGPFCVRIMSDFRLDVLRKNNLREVDCTNAACDVKNIKGGILTPSCPIKTCSVFVSSILMEHHTKNSSKSVHWANSNMHQWATNLWEISKIYMGKGQEATNAGPKDTDSAGMLQLLSCCRLFRTYCSCAEVNKILHIRNLVMHPKSLSFDVVQKDEALKLMIDMISKLENKVSGELNSDMISKTLTEGLANMYQLRDMGLEVVLAKEEEILVVRKLLQDYKTELNTANDDASVRETQMNAAMPLIKMIHENKALQVEVEVEFNSLILLVERIKGRATVSIVP